MDTVINRRCIWQNGQDITRWSKYYNTSTRICRRQGSYHYRQTLCGRLIGLSRQKTVSQVPESSF